jgi:hypothetical protein
MEQSAIDRTQNPDAEKQGGPNRRAVKVRVVGVGVAAFALLAIGAVRYNAMRAPTAHAACVRKSARDEHTMLEAFFQNPPDANALAQIERACAK